jgi:predicted TIM-barrel fold metal-dependent hydrolase
VEIIDAQVHIWEKHHSDRPWADFARRRDRPGAPGARHLPEVTIDQMLMAMAAVGVDAGVIFTPALYRHDNSYSLQAAALHPDRFAAAGNIDPTDPNGTETSELSPSDKEKILGATLRKVMGWPRAAATDGATEVAIDTRASSSL